MDFKIDAVFLLTRIMR